MLSHCFSLRIHSSKAKQKMLKHLHVYLFIYTFAPTFRGLGQPKGFILLKMSR